MAVAGVRCQRLVTVLLAVVCVCTVAEGNPWYHRIIAVGDVHGDKHNFKRVLRMAQLTHESTNFNSWNFCGINSTIPVHRTTLVQMGDLVDRGDDDHGVLKMASSLLQEVNSNETSEDEAVFLIGNHELMNLEGAFQFVNHNHGGYRNAEARKAAFATNGVASQLILNHFRALYVAEDTIFVHAGMDAFHGIRLEYIDETIRGAIKAGNYGHPLLGSRGPLWTRHMIFNAVKGKCKDVERMLHHYNAKRIVVGHTIQRRGIGMYCDGRVFAVDVGISRWVHDNVRALEILVKHDGDRFEVVVSELTEHSGSQVLFRSTHASTTDDSNAL